MVGVEAVCHGPDTFDGHAATAPGGEEITMYPWGPGMMGYGGYGGSPWWGIAMLAFWALVIVGVVLLVAWLVRQGQGQRLATGSADDRALSILRERFARGEIDAEQFEQMRRTLQ
ncbi:MAG TPA: SHOCT domain-containing protein [Thermomicrobiaceae bacterium]|nr:SHOCT domain-containing protein [Thermomicrobiaceae bacterium]